MCSPAMAAIAIVGVGVTAGIMQMQGANTAAKSTKVQSEYEAQVAENNAKIAEAQATDALERGEFAAEQRLTEGQQEVGTQRTVTAGRGVLVGEGSAQAIEEDTLRIAELDAEIIRANAEREAYAARTQQVNFQNQATFTRVRGQNEARALRFQGQTALVSTVGQAAIGAAGVYFGGSSSKKS